jgi:hypothetical protein
MSFQISISGHSSGPHNDAVKAVFEQAIKDLRKIPSSTISGSGYSNDGESITLSAENVPA